MYGNEHSDSGCAVFVRTPAVQSEDAAGFGRCIENFMMHSQLWRPQNSSPTDAQSEPIARTGHANDLLARSVRKKLQTCQRAFRSRSTQTAGKVVGYLAKHFRSRSAQTAGKVIGYLAKHCTTTHFKDREEQIVGTQEKPQ